MVTFKDVFRQLIRDVKSEKLRTFLTVFGIVWGTVAISLMLAFGTGLHKQLIKSTAGLGDRIVIFEDADGDGKHDKRTVFMEGLNLVSGIEVGFGGVWVGAAPYLLFIPHDEKTDKPAGEPKVLLGDGDRVVVEIERVGRLENPVVAERP